jgi:hypothetical protein
MKKRVILKESQLIDMIEKIVKRTQAQQLKEAEAAKGVQSNANGKKSGDKKAEPFTKAKEGGKGKDGNGLNKVGGSIPTSRKADAGPKQGGNKPIDSGRGASAPKKGKIAKENPTPTDPLAFKKAPKPQGRV